MKKIKNSGHLTLNVFLHSFAGIDQNDYYFGTDEKNSCRIDELIIS